MNTALVLGATGSIGNAVSKKLLRMGYRLIGVARCKSDNWLQNEKGDYRIILGDITDINFLRSLNKELCMTNEAPQILIHSAGSYSSSSLTDVDIGYKLLESNLISSATAVGLFGSGMCKHGYGRIILVSSMSAIRGSRSPYYAMAKAGLKGLVASIAPKYANHGVTLNLVLPGPVDSKMFRDYSDNESRSNYLSEIPMNRFAMPPEVEEVICFLASEGASYVTGIEFKVAGGMR